MKNKKAVGIQGGGIRKGTHSLRLSALSLALIPLFAGAAPTGERVVAGKAQVSRPSASQTLVKQDSERTVINWNSFGIGRGESVI